MGWRTREVNIRVCSCSVDESDSYYLQKAQKLWYYQQNKFRILGKWKCKTLDICETWSDFILQFFMPCDPDPHNPISVHQRLSLHWPHSYKHRGWLWVIFVCPQLQISSDFNYSSPCVPWIHVKARPRRFWRRYFSRNGERRCTSGLSSLHSLTSEKIHSDRPHGREKPDRKPVKRDRRRKRASNSKCLFSSSFSLLHLVPTTATPKLLLNLSVLVNVSY